MIICKNCYIPMINVMSFTKDKHESFCRCNKCNRETKHKKLNDGELIFEKVLEEKTRNVK